MHGTAARPAYPVREYEAAILEAVRDYPVTIVSAQTGSGKSTQIPQMLVDAGYRVAVSQPSIPTARTLVRRVCQERGEAVGQTFGYRASLEGVWSEATRCLFATDGLLVVQQLLDQNPVDVLMIDEVHEWNIHIEILVAWMRRRLARGDKTRLVLASATLDEEALALYYNGAAAIDIPGRLFPIMQETPALSIRHDIVRLAGLGRNSLVFLPGKAEIRSFTRDLRQELGRTANILPLHSELSPAQQDLAFAPSREPKIVLSTNIAQTGVTIPDIDAVIDSGMERRVEVWDGVESLRLRPISLQDREQRKGRAGRTKPGIYIDHCPVSADRRHAFPVPAIRRSLLEDPVLRLAALGTPMRELRLMHAPHKGVVSQALATLASLGCLQTNDIPSEIGQTVARLPVNVRFGRMLVEANRRGVLSDMATIVAVQEASGIRAPRDQYGAPARDLWMRFVSEEAALSDALADLALYRVAQAMSERECVENGIDIKGMRRATRTRQKLCLALGRQGWPLESTGDYEEILRCVLAGLRDLVFKRGEDGLYRGSMETPRRIARDSSVGARHRLVVGIPTDIERRDGRISHLLTNVTAIRSRWLD